MSVKLSRVLGGTTCLLCYEAGSPPWGAPRVHVKLFLDEFAKINPQEIDKSEEPSEIDLNTLWMLKITVVNMLKQETKAYEFRRYLTLRSVDDVPMYAIKDPHITRFSEFSRHNQLRVLSSGSLPPKVIRHGGLLFNIPGHAKHLSVEFANSITVIGSNTGNT